MIPTPAPSADLGARLAAHAFTLGLDEARRAVLLGLARQRHFNDGDLLVTEGRPALEVLLLIEGRVALETNLPGRGSVQVDTAEGGDTVGWSWLLPPYRWHFDGRAVGVVDAVALDAPALRAAAAEDPVLGQALAIRVAELLLHRLQAARIRMVDPYSGSKR